MEDKKKICDLLLPALQATRQISTLTDLEFIPATETVVAVFEEKYVKHIDVDGDSGWAMISDIIKHL